MGLITLSGKVGCLVRNTDVGLSVTGTVGDVGSAVVGDIDVGSSVGCGVFGMGDCDGRNDEVGSRDTGANVNTISPSVVGLLVVGFKVGCRVGIFVGASVGMRVGCNVGCIVLGCRVGALEIGKRVGSSVGLRELGCNVGCTVAGKPFAGDSVGSGV